MAHIKIKFHINANNLEKLKDIIQPMDDLNGYKYFKNKKHY